MRRNFASEVSLNSGDEGASPGTRQETEDFEYPEQLKREAVKGQRLRSSQPYRIPIVRSNTIQSSTALDLSLDEFDE